MSRFYGAACNNRRPSDDRRRDVTRGDTRPTRHLADNGTTGDKRRPVSPRSAGTQLVTAMAAVFFCIFSFIFNLDGNKKQTTVNREWLPKPQESSRYWSRLAAARVAIKNRVSAGYSPETRHRTIQPGSAETVEQGTRAEEKRQRVTTQIKIRS